MLGTLLPVAKETMATPPKATSRAPFPMQGLEQRLGLPIKLLSKVGLPKGSTTSLGELWASMLNSGDSLAVPG